MAYSAILRPNLLFSTTSKRAASSISKGHVEYYREFNRLASAGAWDHINLRPKIFSTKKEKAAAMKIWEKMLPEDADWFDRRPNGPLLKTFFSVSLILLCYFMAPIVYDKFVPEQYRCKLKYGKENGGH